MVAEPSSGLSAAELEELFPLLARHLDKLPEPAQAKFLCKAFFLLAHATGHLPAAIRALEEAAATENVSGRSAPSGGGAKAEGTPK
jgi:hypothetical protein